MSEFAPIEAEEAVEILHDCLAQSDLSEKQCSWIVAALKGASREFGVSPPLVAYLMAIAGRAGPDMGPFEADEHEILEDAKRLLAEGFAELLARQGRLQ